MIVILNLDGKVVLLEKLICNGTKTMYKKLKGKNVAIIDIDYSFLRYLGKELTFKTININRSGYPIIKRRDNTVTTLSRFILEYYSKYDEKLKQVLNNPDYEINHKNRNKLDNRIENLEIVTHSDNIKHCKGTNYNVIYSTQKLKQLQQRNINQHSQSVDRKYLNRINGLFLKFIKTGTVDERILKCSYCYLGFKYIKMIQPNSTSNSIEINKKKDLIKYKFMTSFCTNKLIYLEQKKKELIYKTIINNNIKILNRYITRYPNIKEVLKKYKLIDYNNKEELNFEHSNSRNLLLDLYKDIYDSNKYTIDDGDILTTVTLKQFFNVRGKYKSFLVLYLLGLLNRRDDISKPNTVSIRKVHTPSFIKIPVYTDKLLKQVNEISKDLLELNLNKFTYFLVREEFGEETADLIYKNSTSKLHYQDCVRAKEDILQFLKTDKDIHTNGFITKEEIFEHVESINVQRAIKDEEHNEINKSFTNFITSLLLYNTDTKHVLEDLGLVYTTLNNKIINNIKKHQQKHNLNFNVELKSKMKVLILKELLK